LLADIERFTSKVSLHDFHGPESGILFLHVYLLFLLFETKSVRT
jgi:hypothetical protein